MPWVGLNSETGVRVDISMFDNPRAELPKGKYTCQLCGGELFIRGQHTRRGYAVRAHFYHARDCDPQYDAHPESPEHLWGKIHLAEELRKEYGEYSNPVVELEVPIPMSWRKRGRQADILVTWPLGWRVAHEIQLAPITPEELKERTNDYLRAGIDVIWYLGKSADTTANENWCLQTFGVCLTIQWFRV